MKRIAWVQLYPNKHVLDIANVMEDCYDCEIDHYFFKGILPERLNQGWCIPENHTIIPSRCDTRFFRLVRRIIKSEVCIIFGALDPLPWMLLIFVLAINLRKRVFFISEGLRHRPGFLKILVSKCLVNRRSVCYLSVGSGADADFRQLGMSHWSIRRFAFAEKYREVEPFNRQPDEQLVILGVGRLIPRKNFISILNSLRGYTGKRRILVKIAGSGEMHNLLERTAISDLPSTVKLKLLGNCDFDELDREFRVADIFVCPSKYDGWGVVVNQALAYGLPIVTSEGTRSARDNLVCHGRNGFIVENDESLGGALNILIKDDALRASMSKESFRHARSWVVGEIASRLFSVINDESIDYESGVLQKL